MKSKFRIVKLGDLIEQVTRKNKEKRDFSVFSVTNSMGFAKSDEYFNKEVFSKNLNNYNLVYPGEFAYNPSRINVGSIDFLKNDDPVLVSPLYNVFKTLSGLNNDFLKYFIRSPHGLVQISNLTTGSVRDSLKYSSLERMKIPLPPLEDQKRIASLLSRIEDLIAKRKESIRLLDEFVKSVFLEMFGDPVRNEKGGYDSIKLNDVATKITDGTHQPPKFVTKGIPFLFVSNIINNKIDYKTSKYITESEFTELIKRTPIEIGDILFTTVGSYGNPAIVESEKKFCFQRHIAYIKPNHEIIDYFYLFSALTSYSVKAQVDQKVRGVAQKTLNLIDLKNVIIPFPPLRIQRKFVSIVKAVKMVQSKYQESLFEIEKFYLSVSQRAFRGRC